MTAAPSRRPALPNHDVSVLLPDAHVKVPHVAGPNFEPPLAVDALAFAPQVLVALWPPRAEVEALALLPLLAAGAGAVVARVLL